MSAHTPLAMQRSRHLRRALGFLFVGCIAVTMGCSSAMGPSSGSSGTPASDFGAGLPPAVATPEIGRLERAMFGRVNRDRAKNQLPPLTFDPRLCDIARSHSKDMRDNHFFEHESPSFGALDSRLHRAGYLFLKARENLAEAITVDDAEDGLLKSPHHYENLMAEDITHVGIGIVKGGVVDPRNLTVTQIFSTPAKRESNAEATAAIAQHIARGRAAAGAPSLARLPELDRIACDELGKVQGELDGSQLKVIGSRVVAQLGKRPIAGVSGVSAGAQVVVDSSQYRADGAIESSNARGYGFCVDHGPKGGKSPRLRVLILVGLRGG